jgi:hypothetical protein
MMTDRQEMMLYKASGWVTPPRRADFIRSVQNHLADKPYISGSDLRHAIKQMLSAYGISAPDTMENSNELR